ncbi:MAG: lipocalin family protein [Gemmatimonadales bacterium]|jgi:apolipoprotein D and lipocalin family protein
MGQTTIVMVFVAALGLASLAGFGASKLSGQESDEPTTVESVDLERYVGLWYEIAKIPNRFQKKCASGTTAFYSIRDDGNIDVVNRCLDGDGEIVRAVGLAKVEDAETNARLKVSFVNVLGIRLFWGDYWIIELGDDYEYAVVGHPKRDYGWILARTPALSDETIQQIHSLLREQGYSPEDFVSTLQDTES